MHVRRGHLAKGHVRARSGTRFARAVHLRSVLLVPSRADLHIHYANEELIVVRAGTPTLHTLDGSRRLETGAVVACLRGPRGAHRLENDSEEVARVLILSTLRMPEVVEYPERPGGGVFVMTEPAYTGAPYDPARGRILRVFERDKGWPVPPEEPAPEGETA